jgi:hypothetical protein
MLVLAASALAQSAPSPGPEKGYSDRPASAKPLSATMVDDAIQLFKDKNFGGTMVQVSEVTGKPAWQDQEFHGRSENKFTSLRWNLPRGVVVSLFENADCLGRMICIWGSGEIPSLGAAKLNDRLSCWAWNYVGGTPSIAGAPPKGTPQKVLDGRAPRPKYAKEIDTLPNDTIQLFKDRECKGGMTAIDRVTDQTPGSSHDMPGGIGKGTSSLKWKLPDGVVVVFSEGKYGEGRQLAIWGEGMFEACNQWDMNDRIAQWAWYYAGEK